MPKREETYALASGQFYAVVEHHGRHTSVILVGGRKRGCVSITVTRGNGGALEGLLHAHYDPNCNVTGSLERGRGTLAMIRAALSFAFQQYPAMQHVYLRDDSHVACGEYDLYLPPVEVGKSGKTWYQRHFGARCDDHDVQKKLDAFAAQCAAPQVWTDWWPRVGRFEERGPARKQLEDRLKPLFDKYGGRLRDMLRAMRQEDACDVYVRWLAHYFQAFIGTTLQVVDFVIDRNADLTVEAVRLEASPYATELQRRASEATRKLDIFSATIPRTERRGIIDGGGPKSTFLRF